MHVATTTFIAAANAGSAIFYDPGSFDDDLASIDINCPAVTVFTAANAGSSTIAYCM